MLILFVVTSVIIFALNLWGRAEVRRFLAAHDSIDSAEALERFKALARRNMYGALGLIVVLAGWIPAIVYLIIKGPGPEKVFATLVAGAFAAFSHRAKPLEVATRSLPSDPALTAEYERVSRSWEKKALPDF